MARVLRTSRVAENIKVKKKGGGGVVGTSGETLTKEPINRELAALSGMINGGIDRDNFREGIITSEKFALDTFHKIHRVEEAGAANLDVYAGRATKHYP